MSYDVFLSHSHVDKVWTHELCDELAGTEYNGRMLRVWLDEQVLDPGHLSSARELETALDRSRRLAFVLTPESLASHWVQHEIRYFLKIRRASDIAVIRRQSCDLPETLAGGTLIDWAEPTKEGKQHEQLLNFLRPEADSYAEYEHRRAVRRAWESARYAQSEDFNPKPTEENSELLKLLLSNDVGNLDREGLALAGFDRVGQLIAEENATESYNLRMVLGEFLAVAVLRNPAYAQVAAAFVDKDFESQTTTSFLTFRNRALGGKAGPASTTNLLFAVARAGSKLAEIDPVRIDLSTMAAVLHRLDRRSQLDSQAQTVAIMVGRTLGKLRGSALVDALICAIVEWGGDASHLAALAAIASPLNERDPVVYLTEELEALAADSNAQLVSPPLPRVARLLFDPESRLGRNDRLDDEVLRSRSEFMGAFGAWKPDGDWPELVKAPAATRLENGPIVGTVRRITLANMESYADRLGPTEIACLTEARIVDALLDGAGGFIIDESEAEAPLGNRLRIRGSRYATYRQQELDHLEDGCVIALWPAAPEEPPRGFAVKGS